MRQALIGPVYFIYVVDRLTRRQLPGYYINVEHAREVANGMAGAYISNITAISYDGGQTFRTICIAGESQQKLDIIDEMNSTE